MKAPQTAALVIRGDANDLSPNLRLHFRTRSARIKRWREAAKVQAAYELNWPPQPRRVRLDWTIRRWRSVDAANIHGSAALKAIEDGLVDAGIVPDDSTKWVEWGTITQEVGQQYRYREEVVVTITVMEGTR